MTYLQNFNQQNTKRLEQKMAEKSQQQINQGQQESNQEGQQNNEELSQADKQIYQQIFKSLNHIDKKVKNAKSKLHKNQSAQKQAKNTNFKQIVEKLIESKQNSQIVNKEDLSADIHQSFQRTVIDIYSENQKLKKKMIQMQKIIKDQNHKIYQQHTKEQQYIKQVQKLRLQLAQAKDNNIIANRGGPRAQQTENKKQAKKMPIIKIMIFGICHRMKETIRRKNSLLKTQLSGQIRKILAIACLLRKGVDENCENMVFKINRLNRTPLISTNQTNCQPNSQMIIMNKQNGRMVAIQKIVFYLDEFLNLYIEDQN